MELKHETWYWFSTVEEGDIFYPVYVVDDNYMMMDGEHYKIEDNKDAVFTEAVMPT